MRVPDRSHVSSCPLAPVHRRLEDAHQQWHQAERAYFHPEHFRIAIQTTVQTLRTVTFILQNNKEKIPNFNLWYEGWQNDLAADPLMRWMVNARNRIEKQGDLEIHSFVRAEIIASHMSSETLSVDMPASLFENPLSILDRIPSSDLRDYIFKHGILRIQRRWVENTLPNHELLDATATAYGRLSQLLDDAHRQMESQLPTSLGENVYEEDESDSKKGRLPCMIGHADIRSLNIELSNKNLIELEKVTHSFEDKDAKEVIRRYGNAHEGMLGPKNANVETVISSLFSTARKVFEIDHYHQTMIFLFRRGTLIHFFGIQPENHAQKYLLMKRVAREVTVYQADSLIQLGEMWFAPAELAEPFMRADESPRRREALTATLIRRQGESIILFAEITRNGDNVALGDTEVQQGGSAFAFSSVYEVWGRPVPSEWKELVKESGNEKIDKFR